MAQTNQQIKESAKELAERLFVQPNATATVDTTTLVNAVQKIDTAMNATTTQVQNAMPGVVLKTALLNYFKQSWPNATNQQAGIALALWALKEVGLI